MYKVFTFVNIALLVGVSLLGGAALFSQGWNRGFILAGGIALVIARFARKAQ